MTCEGCAATFTRYTFELTASLAAGDDSVTVPVAAPRVACPECGRPVEADVDEPLT